MGLEDLMVVLNIQGEMDDQILVLEEVVLNMMEGRMADTMVILLLRSQ